MIETVAAGLERDEWNWVLRPNQALGLGQIRFFFALVLMTALLVTGFSWLHGNVFAPLFAVVELIGLALVLRIVWRRAGRAEVIRLDASALSVSRLPECIAALEVHPHWVRVRSEAGQVVLTCQGRRVVVGEFLGAAERERLLHELERGLESVRDRGSYRSSENLG